LNKNSITEKEKIDYLEAIAHLLTPAALARMDKKTYQEILHPLFYYISPDNIDRWHRNADRVLKLSSE
ncbi:MAG: hypothetical protein GX554_00970, partial [Elusimicrobia bacterium]|nr:hypothetical protein [Elusimicrobiota bacterium]